MVSCQPAGRRPKSLFPANYWNTNKYLLFNSIFYWQRHNVTLMLYHFLSPASQLSLDLHVDWLSLDLMTRKPFLLPKNCNSYTCTCTYIKCWNYIWKVGPQLMNLHIRICKGNDAGVLNKLVLIFNLTIPYNFYELSLTLTLKQII